MAKKEQDVVTEVTQEGKERTCKTCKSWAKRPTDCSANPWGECSIANGGSTVFVAGHKLTTKPTFGCNQWSDAE